MGDTIGDIDLVNPDTYAERVPFEWFDHLRAEHPVIWHPEPAPNKGFWAVTRYDDLTRVHMDWETFSSELGAVSLEELDDEQLEVRKSMLETDPPRHTELRKICSKRFSARGVGKYEDWIRDVARDVLDEALPKGEFDFVSEISRDLPIRFLCSIFTVPQEDAPQLIAWGDSMIANQDPDLSAAVIDKVDTEAYRLFPFRSPTALDVFAYADRQRDQRLAEPADDVLQALTIAQSEGVLERARVPQLLRRADDRRQRDHPAHDQPRHARPDGTPRAAAAAARSAGADPDRDRGDPALGLAGAAVPPHRDPRRRDARRSRSSRATRSSPGTSARTATTTIFPDPYTFDVTRKPNDHVTFGPGGPHFCLGAHLARLETKILFQELIPRLDTIELTGPVERIRSNFVNGIKRMPVRVTTK